MQASGGGTEIGDYSLNKMDDCYSMNEVDEDEIEEIKARLRVWNEINSAFSNDLILSSDPTFPGPFGESARQVLQGKDWRALTADDMYQLRGELHFLTPAAFWHYFPAFTRQLLIRRPLDTLGENLLSALLPEHTGGEGLGVNQLNERQRCAVVKYLEWYSEENPTSVTETQRAIRYWRG